MTDRQLSILQSAVPKSEILASERADGRPDVDIVCAVCGAHLGAIRGASTKPVLSTWAPQLNPPRRGGEPLWSFEAGALPEDDADVVVFHCFNCGHGVVSGRELRTAVEKYRDSGRRRRVPVAMRVTHRA